MRLPRVHFTLRSIMITVAAVAAILAIRIEISRMRQRSVDYLWRSFDHRLHELDCDGTKLISCVGPLYPAPSTRDPRKAAYYAAMARKWAYAAEHPWLPVEPDPPEPK